MSSRRDRLPAFLKDCSRIGQLKGFLYFDLFQRGREEMMVAVKLDVADQSAENAVSAQGKPLTSVDFLVAGYAKYQCPYVWIRSEPSEALRNAGIVVGDDWDNPLVLATTTNWQYSSVKAADVIVELTSMTLDPVPKNPFAVDFDFFEELSLFERTVAQAAMINFLRRVFVAESSTIYQLVFEDIARLSTMHLTAMQALLQHAALLNAMPTPSSSPSGNKILAETSSESSVDDADILRASGIAKDDEFDVSQPKSPSRTHSGFFRKGFE